MIAVYKETIEKIQNTVSVEFCGLVKILKIDTQNEKVCIWYESDLSKAEKTISEFRIFGTGHIFEVEKDEINNLEYINTIKLCNDGLIFHIYLIKK